MKKWLSFGLLALVCAALLAFGNADAPARAESEVAIRLDGVSASADGQGAEVSEGLVTITKAGRYVFTGEFAGQIRVKAGEKDDVTLVLAGASVECADGSAIYVLEADNVVIELQKDTQNRLSDAASYELDEEGADAAVYSKADLDISGEGALEVVGAFRHGVVSKDDLVIESGTISVTSAADCLRGKDSVTVSGGALTLNAGSDGILSNNDTDEGKGNVLIAGGSLDIAAATDGIQAARDLSVSGGAISLVTGGGSAAVERKSDAFGGPRQWQSASETDTASEADTASCKGLKAGGALTVSGGTVTADCEDDALHAGGDVCVKGGSLSLKSGDDAIHSDANVVIDGGSIDIPYCYEGVEGATITVNAGDINIVAYDDGLNAAGGDGSASGSMRGQWDAFAADAGKYIVVNGGSITVVSDGDCLDSNGDLTINGGTLKLTCNGNGNTALDASGNYANNGGDITTNDGSESGGGMGGPGGFGGGRGGERGGFGGGKGGRG